MKFICKTCKIQFESSKQRIYCSNKCKFTDYDYNKSRVTKIKNDNNKILKCSICDWISNDINNLSGAITTHLRKYHPNIFEEDYKSYFEEIEKEKDDNIEYLKCCFCNWKSIDLTNKSGMFTSHLKKKHNIVSIIDFLELHPEYDNLWSTIQKRYNKNIETISNEDNYVECLICKEKLNRLTNSHLEKHGLTPTQYKEKFNTSDTMSNLSSEKQSLATQRLNEKFLNDKKLYNKPLPIHTQKAIDKRIENNFEEYSKMINEQFELISGIDDYKIHKGTYICKICNTKMDLQTRFPRCNVCNPIYVSKEEKEIRDFLQNELKLELICNNKNVIKNTELDIFVPEFNIAIEYNGLFWHSELSSGKTEKYHLRKTQMCEDKDIKLIHIFGDEWLNKKDLVKSRLSYLFNRNIKSIGARDTYVKDINVEDYKNFIQRNHLQGYTHAKIKIGAFYNDKLLAVMSFGGYRKALGAETKDNEYELLRFAVDKDYAIAGIASKLLKYFIETYKPIKIISYADRRWTSPLNNFYIRLGFKFKSFTSPNYWYTNYKERFYRFNFIKSKLVKEGEDQRLTEAQIMKNRGFDRIWDCGSIKYEYTIEQDNNIERQNNDKIS